MNRILLLLTHIVTNLAIQATLLAVLIWHYDTSVKAYVLYILLCVGLLLGDYVIVGMLLHETSSRLKHKWLFHTPDLIFATPSMLCVIAEILTRSIEMPGAYFIAGIVVLTIEALVVMERVYLIRKP